MDLLHDKIVSSLAMNSKDSLSPQLVEIWRLTSEAHSNVGQLPLSLLPFNKTEEFLSNIGDFSYRVAVRDLENDPLSEKELASLENLYEQSGEIKDELRQVQHIALNNNLRWMDVQLALANQDEQADNTIIDGFKTVEEKVEGYSESNVDTLVGDNTPKEQEYIFLNDPKINEKQVLSKSKDLFNVKNKNDLVITKSGDGSDIPIYSVSYRNDQKNAYMDMTEQGGHPITLLVDRPLQEKKISLNEGLKKAEEYLQKFNLDHMDVFQSSEYDNIGVYSFLYSENDIRIHSDSVEIKVALDNGDILGFTAKSYLMNHQKREIPEPTLSIEERSEERRVGNEYRNI